MDLRINNNARSMCRNTRSATTRHQRRDANSTPGNEHRSTQTDLRSIISERGGRPTVRQLQSSVKTILALYRLLRQQYLVLQDEYSSLKYCYQRVAVLHNKIQKEADSKAKKISEQDGRIEFIKSQINDLLKETEKLRIRMNKFEEDKQDLKDYLHAKEIRAKVIRDSVLNLKDKLFSKILVTREEYEKTFEEVLQYCPSD